MNSILLIVAFFVAPELRAQVAVPADFPEAAASPREVLRQLQADPSAAPPIEAIRTVESSLEPSDEVLDDKDRAGKVVEVFSNGKAKVQYSFRSRIVPTESLARKLKPEYVPASPACYGKVCVGDSVLDAKGSVGTVTNVFSNGRAKVQYSVTSSILPVAELSPRTASVRPPEFPPAIATKAQDRVLDAADEIATVVEVFSNGQAKIQYSFTSKVVALSSLANEVRGRPAETRAACLNGLCVGDRVIDQGGSVGTLNAIYSNGKAEVRYSFSSPIVSLASLAKAR
ncbi:MAG: hypothetical protein HY553_19165 [Elusimicrobia bacterium]|nr:hypothetical protein [Elusimicrobiota bacterium]